MRCIHAGAFQDVTLRLIAERLLPGRHCRTFVQGELSQLRPCWHEHPRYDCRYHAFCSPHNSGASALLGEVSKTFARVIKVTTESDSLEACESMIVYLNAQTWTSGATSAAFAADVERAMTLGVHLLLAHEMIGVDGQEARAGCDFHTFFSCARGSTPQNLLRKGIYNKIAVPLKGGAWREASMVMMGQALAKAPPRRSSMWPRGRLRSIIAGDRHSMRETFGRHS